MVGRAASSQLTEQVVIYQQRTDISYPAQIRCGVKKLIDMYTKAKYLFTQLLFIEPAFYSFNAHMEFLGLSD